MILLGKHKISPGDIWAVAGTDSAVRSAWCARVVQGEELVAKSVARSFAGAEARLTPEGATRLVTELGACKTPYICPRGRPVMIFTSLNDLKRKFDR